MAGQSETLVPADRKLYALRDASGTVPSIPLIASSIMSKKLAEDLDGLVLDVKVGSGAFMTDMDRARQLARTMVGIGDSHGVEVNALITDMDQPLGNMVGNSNEIAESIDVLEGNGPADLTEITIALAEEMVRVADLDDPEGRVEKALSSGAAMEKFLCMVEAHDGDPRIVEDRSLLPMATETTAIEAPRSGYVARCDARAIGIAAMRLGAGRTRKEDDVDPGVGIELHAKVGAEVSEGDVLCVLTHRAGDISDALERARTAFEIGDEAPAETPLIRERITYADGW
jgi:pyrimidine-nucleoside phosphorylase